MYVRKIMDLLELHIFIYRDGYYNDFQFYVLVASGLCYQIDH